MFMNKNNNSDWITTTIIDSVTKKIVWLEHSHIGENSYPQNKDGPTMIKGITNYISKHKYPLTIYSYYVSNF